jgi:hypothetical protein
MLVDMGKRSAERANGSDSRGNDMQTADFYARRAEVTACRRRQTFAHHQAML